MIDDSQDDTSMKSAPPAEADAPRVDRVTESAHDVSDASDTQNLALAPAPADAPVQAQTGADADDHENRFLDVVSGRFDADEESTPESAPKRVLAAQAETPKLHKVLAQAGMGSRLEMEQLILEGRISVNNEPAHIGQRIQYGDHVKVNGKPIRIRIEPPSPRVIAYHKPVGEVVTHDDPQNRPTVFRRLPKLQNGKWQSVGRLDLNTEGLLLFTSSGELANNLMHPRFGLEREYAVRVLGALSNDEKQRLLEGVRLDDGQAHFGTIEDGGGEGANCWYRITISEGRNREVRRMFEAVGHAVSRLIRIRYGAMLLPRGLRRGAWMELDDADINALRRASSQPGTRDAGARAPLDGESERRDGNEGAASSRRRKRGSRSGAERRPDDRPRDPTQGPGGPHRQPGAAAGSGPARGRNRAAPQDDEARGRNRAAPQDDEARADRQAAESQPDPMKTAFGYIGADSFTRQRQGQGRGPRSGGNAAGGRGGGAGGGGGGNGRRGGRSR